MSIKIYYKKFTIKNTLNLTDLQKKLINQITLKKVKNKTIK